MDNQWYLNDLRERTDGSAKQQIEARPYKNAKGVEELIFLLKETWAYVEWLEENDAIDFAQWVVHCDNNPVETFCLSHLLMFWLWDDECYRHKLGLPTPTQNPPAGFDEHISRLHTNDG